MNTDVDGQVENLKSSSIALNVKKKKKVCGGIKPTLWIVCVFVWHDTQRVDWCVIYIEKRQGLQQDFPPVSDMRIMTRAVRLSGSV